MSLPNAIVTPAARARRTRSRIAVCTVSGSPSMRAADSGKSVPTSTMPFAFASRSRASLMKNPCSMEATPPATAFRAPCSVEQCAATLSPARAASLTMWAMSSAE